MLVGFVSCAVPCVPEGLFVAEPADVGFTSAEILLVTEVLAGIVVVEGESIDVVAETPSCRRKTIPLEDTTSLRSDSATKAHKINRLPKRMAGYQSINTHSDGGGEI